ncbi:class I SAM-dependent methyltransferase [Stenotrophomonas nitritireducens]|nr:class I SAM-dependent methyltransferase [Stenotrophomonas nitritireducens]
MALRKRLLDAVHSNEYIKRVLFNPFAEYHQWRLLGFVRDAAHEIGAGGSVIDIGAGELKYRSQFSHCRYVSNDLCVGDEGWNYEGIDLVSSAYAIPVEDDSFDAVLCIQVMEHLDNPDGAFREFHRILKGRGRAYVSAPLLAGEHQQPHDFLRYTRYGFSVLGERNGFRVLSISPHGGCAIAVETLMWAAFWELAPLPRQSLARYAVYVLLYPVKLLTGALALLLDMLDKKKSMTINYNVVYEKVVSDC